MTHRTLPSFWLHYDALPAPVRRLADRQFERLRSDPGHPSLYFKRVGTRRQAWSARVGIHYRALALDRPDTAVWFWIGSHAAYDRLVGGL